MSRGGRFYSHEGGERCIYLLSLSLHHSFSFFFCSILSLVPNHYLSPSPPVPSLLRLVIGSILAASQLLPNALQRPCCLIPSTPISPLPFSLSLSAFLAASPLPGRFSLTSLGSFSLCSALPSLSISGSPFPSSVALIRSTAPTASITRTLPLPSSLSPPFVPPRRHHWLSQALLLPLHRCRLPPTSPWPTSPPMPPLTRSTADMKEFKIWERYLVDAADLVLGDGLIDVDGEHRCGAPRLKHGGKALGLGVNDECGGRGGGGEQQR